jgi:hypothetical protein
MLDDGDEEAMWMRGRGGKGSVFVREKDGLNVVLNVQVATFIEIARSLSCSTNRFSAFRRIAAINKDERHVITPFTRSFNPTGHFTSSSLWIATSSPATFNTQISPS